ncbi:MAG: HAD family acid phosphatase [Pseudolabrys sp.]
MHRKLIVAIAAFAWLGLVPPVVAAPPTPAAYDCQTRMTQPRPAPPPPAGDENPWQCPAPQNQKLSSALHWFRDSLEYCRLTTSVYDAALRAAYRQAVRYGPKGWIVFMDADETVLDNSLYEYERERCGSHYTGPTWAKWIKDGIAGAIPGAVAFTQTVHALGGLVAIVTNRDIGNDVVTRTNLKTLGIWFDYEIGQKEGEPSEKSQRWRDAVAILAQRVGGSPRPVLWLGDQVTDLPILDANGHIVRAMSQHDAGSHIGSRYFLLPNPVYGNWSHNPEN